MNRVARYPAGVRGSAVRLLLDHEPELYLQLPALHSMSERRSAVRGEHQGAGYGTLGDTSGVVSPPGPSIWRASAK